MMQVQLSMTSDFLVLIMVVFCCLQNRLLEVVLEFCTARNEMISHTLVLPFGKLELWTTVFKVSGLRVFYSIRH